MAQIKLLKPWQDSPAGAVLIVDAQEASALIARRIGRIATSEDTQEVVVEAPQPSKTRRKTK